MTLVANAVFGYFLEDIAHEYFVRSLVERVVEEERLATQITHDVRNATGGRGRVLSELETLLRDIRGGAVSSFALLIVVIDANCTRLNAMVRDLRQRIARAGYAGRVVLGVPDPHVERWYLSDPQAVRNVAGASLPSLPRYKCQRDVYKNALRDSFRQAGIELYLDGAEYGPDIVKGMDLYHAGQNDRSLSRFVDELRAAVRQMALGASSS